MSKYEAVYFVVDNQAINRVRVDSDKTRNRGTFSGSLAALVGNGLRIPKALLDQNNMEESCLLVQFAY